MKRRIAIFLSLCLLFSVTGCNEKQTSVTTETIPSESISETLEEGTTTTTVASSEVTTTTTLKETTEISTSTADTTSESTQTTSVIPSESTRETTTSTTVPKETTAAPTATPTPKPTATPEPTPTPEPTATPTPTPEPEPEPEPEFDINYWVQFEKDYAVQCGFELNPAAVHCWDTPINANARCIYLERDLRDNIDYYASIAEEYDITMIWVWYEDLGGGEYQIYTGYA